MLSKALSLKRYLCALSLCLGAFVFAAQAQQDQETPEQADEVLRISSDLVQTDVMVFDKQGRFIENLQREQFELRVDGKPKPISFFERIKAGSASEDSQLAAARGNARLTLPGQEPGKVVPLDRGRTVLFYIDDLHMAIENVQPVKKMLLQFIEREMGQNDEAAITSASGQIGFLQQVTGDKTVLRAALERLQGRPPTQRDYERPPMSDILALSVERYDLEITDYFADRIMVDNPGISRDTAREMVRRRAHLILQQSANVTNNTILALSNLIISAMELPGRKLLFFISDGFLVDNQTANVGQNLRRLSDAAARAGVVIYTLDARGLSTGPFDVTSDDVDPTFRLARANNRETTAMQEPLRTLAADTGGRALLNTNALSLAATNALKETSVYYLLAWRPEEEQSANKFHKIEVSIVGRPELVVRVRRGYTEQEAKAKPRRDASDAPATETKASTGDLLLKAIGSRFRLTALPATLFVSFADAPSTGSYITASTEVDDEGLVFAPVDGKQVALVDLGGIVYNDRGDVVSSFQTQLRVSPPATETQRRSGIVYNYQAKLKPGLYQVRVAVRDSRSGRMGSAVQWIEIPDLASRRLSLSSLTVGERVPDTSEAKANETSEAKKPEEPRQNVFLSVSRRFSRSSRLRFLTHIYNAARGADGNQPPDVALQVQIFRDNQPVLTTALSKVKTAGVQDLGRLPYAAEIALDTMPAGRYVLQVTVIDRIAKTSASQNVTFEIG